CLSKRHGGHLPRPSAKIAAAVCSVLGGLSACNPSLTFAAPPALAKNLVLTGDIPAQPLASALEAFARQTGLHLVYCSDLVRNQRCRSVSAGLGVEEALARLLDGTGLKFQSLTAHSVRIIASAETRSPSAPRDVVPEIIVSASRRDESLQRVPITIQVL